MTYRQIYEELDEVDLTYSNQEYMKDWNRKETVFMNICGNTVISVSAYPDQVQQGT